MAASHESLNELSRLLQRITREHRTQEAMHLISEHFAGQLVPTSGLRLEEAQRIVRSMNPGCSAGPVAEACEKAGVTGVQALIDALCTLSLRDGLTGLYNRRYFDDQLESEIRRAKRALAPMCVMIGDIDHFKAVNDKFGHALGDRVLIAASEAFASSLRGTDSVARYGGEEFAALLPGTSSTGAVMVAERVRSAVQALRLADRDRTVTATISIGLAAFAPGDDESALELLKRADGQLYRAKWEGRNRVCCSSEDLARMKPAGVSNEERSLLFR